MHSLPPITRLVVDLDLSEQGAHAIRWAAGLAGELCVPIVAWVMVENRSAERSIEIERQFEADTAASAHRWLITHDVVIDELHIASGRRNDDLIASIEEGDIVILGVDDTEGFSQWALGSHAHELLHALRCPLIIVPPCGPAPDDAPIVVGVDSTVAHGLVLDWTTALARVLHRDIVPIVADDSPGDPASVLADVSLGATAFLTVVGARDEHALGGLLVGGVVDHLLHRAPRPVAIISFGAMRDAGVTVGAR